MRAVIGGATDPNIPNGIVKQTSATDTTAGSVMTVGAFGLGTNSGRLATDTRLETTSGLWRTNNATLNVPLTSNCQGLTIAGSSTTNCSQILMNQSSNRIWVQQQSAGVWSGWIEVLRTSNVQTSTTDTTAGALMAVGAFGLGNAGTAPLVTLDDAKTAGLYRYASSDPSAPSSGSAGPVLVMVDQASRVHQVAAVNVTPGSFRTRYWNGTTWGDWQQVQVTDWLNSTRIDVASAATVNLTSSAPSTRHINITGTTTITGFTVAAGQCYFVRFNAALTLTNNANIVTQTGANITTAAGDTCILRATAANVVEVLSFSSTVNKSIGVGQTWQDVTGSRALSTTYTNSTGKPIEVQGRCAITTTNSSIVVTVQGVAVTGSANGAVNHGSYVSAIVPDGASYNFTVNSGVGSGLTVWELR
jgi:hypothetical protein